MKKILVTIIVMLITALMFAVSIQPVLSVEPKTFEVLWSVPLLDNDLSSAEIFGTDVGDVDGDGVADVAVVPDDAGSGSYPRPADPSTFQVIRSDGTPLWSKSVLLDWGRIALRDIDLDGRCEVFAFGITTDGTYGAVVYAFDDDGTMLWDFHGTVDYWGSVAFLSFINLDADPELEVLTCTIGWERRTNYAIDSDGSLMWSFTTEEYMGHPVVSDVTGEGDEEIILASFQDIYVLDKSGGVVWQQAPHSDSPGYGPSVASGDITGDGINDVVVTYAAYDGFSYHNTLYVYRNDGSLLWHESYPKNDDGYVTKPILMDLDGDNVKEIILYGNKKISAYKHVGTDGTLLWTFGNSTFFNEHVWVQHFDINRDSVEEIVFQKGTIVYALSALGEVVAEYELPVNGRLLWNVRVPHIDGPEEEIYAKGDVNNDSFDELIIQEKINGQYYVAVVKPRPEVHDVAVVDVTPSTNRTYVGHPIPSVRINVTVTNEGDMPENCTVIVYADSDTTVIGDEVTIGTQHILNLTAGEYRTLTFLWDTTGVTPCHNYTITAVAVPVPHETDTADNTLSSPTLVKVKLMGDVNGDGEVDMKDVYEAAKAFGSYPNHPRWNPDADICGDNKVDMRDIWIVVTNFGTCK